MTKLGFKALYGSGWQLAATKSMYPDIGIYQSHQMVELVLEMRKGIEGARNTGLVRQRGQGPARGPAGVRGHGGGLRRADPDLHPRHRADPGRRGRRSPGEPGSLQPHLRPHRERGQAEAEQGAGAPEGLAGQAQGDQGRRRGHRRGRRHHRAHRLDRRRPARPGAGRREDGDRRRARRPRSWAWT